MTKRTRSQNNQNMTKQGTKASFKRPQKPENSKTISMKHRSVAQLLSTLMILSAITPTFSEKFAILAAGSNGYKYYQHQANVCHAYQTLLHGQIPASNIIVFIYNDIALNADNPFPGKIFNKPNGQDIYSNCGIDYMQAELTPTNFINVITGNSSAMKGIGTGRVLESGSSDSVFIYFAGNGGPNFIDFSTGPLFASSLQTAIQKMQSQGLFKNLLVYLEAGESGSMFPSLNATGSVYALTSSSAKESAYGTYCPSDDVVQGAHIGTCLGSLFSVSWLEETDSSNRATTSLQAQYESIKARVNLSTVTQFGNLNLAKLPLSTFFGTQSSENLNFEE